MIDEFIYKEKMDEFYMRISDFVSRNEEVLNWIKMRRRNVFSGHWRLILITKCLREI